MVERWFGKAVALMAIAVGVVTAVPSFNGQYSSILSTLDYTSSNGCSADTHTEYISTPNYATSRYTSPATAQLDRFDLGLAFEYNWQNPSSGPCTTSRTDQTLRNEYLGNWLYAGNSVNKGSENLNGQNTQKWVSDETWLDADYNLYVASNGDPVREIACIQSTEFGYYAYVTDFSSYTRGTPDFNTYFAKPASCSNTPSANPFIAQSRVDETPESESRSSKKVSSLFAELRSRDKVVSEVRSSSHIDSRRARQRLYYANRINSNTNAINSPLGSTTSMQPQTTWTSADCSSYSYSGICQTLQARIAAADAVSDSDNVGAIIGIVIGCILGTCVAYVFMRWLCRECCCRSTSDATWASTYTADPTPQPMVTFHYENEQKEEKRPEGAQLTREKLLPRDDWRAKCAAIDFTYAVHDDGRPYWDESACYRLTPFAARELENATRELHARCMDAVARVVNSEELMLKLGIPAALFPRIRASWNGQYPSIYGRFDLMYDGRSPPKLLEYNAETPTLLIESGIAQRTWLQDMVARASLPGRVGQFNELESSLAEVWRLTKSEGKVTGDLIHFACLAGHQEDMKNRALMERHAREAGFRTKAINMEDIRWDDARQCFQDPDGVKITTCWKLYPLEWMAADALAHTATADTLWIEPAWKLILSSKGILPLLWEMFPNHANLIPAAWDESVARSWGTRYVSKPLQGREGQMTTVHESNGSPVFHRGVREDDPDSVHGLGARLIYQQFVSPPTMMGQLPPTTTPIVSPKSASAPSPPGGIVVKADPPLITTPPPPYDAPPPAYDTSSSVSVAVAVPLSDGATPTSLPPSFDAVTGAPSSSVVTISVTPLVAADVPPPRPTNYDHPLYPVFGSWVVGGQPAGIVIREDAVLITNNESRIIPHYVESEFKTSPPYSVPPELRETVPESEGSTTFVVYPGYRQGYVYRRSMYWYPMCRTQAHFYRIHRPAPVFRPAWQAPIRHNFGGFSSGHHFGGGG